ncbi:MAG: iron donor protein CyaY [Gammaproteobacteria bacterium]|nr:iron donor protein CyaY [Gammaproteobacteria bacterium]
MTESEFNQQIDTTLLQIEELLDECDVDIDYENSAGILTLELENGSQVIINRQVATQQLWVAAIDGGYHFDFSEKKQQWLLDRDGSELFTQLNRILSQQSGEQVELAP